MARNPVQDAIRKIATEIVETKFFDTTGIIINFDSKTGLADVEVMNKNGVTGTLHDVPATLDTKGGIDGPALRKGDKVIVSFSDGMGSEPQITRRIVLDYEAEYMEEMKTEQGTFVPDSMIYVIW